MAASEVGVGDDICVVLILPPSPARPGSSRSPQVSFVNYVHVPALWVYRVAVPEQRLGVDLALALARPCL